MARFKVIFSKTGNFFLKLCTVVGMTVILFTGIYVFSAFAATGKLLGYQTTEGVFLKHEDLETYGGFVFLNNVAIKTVIGGHQRVLSVNVNPWDVVVKVDTSVDTQQYIRAKVIPSFRSHVLRDTFTDADKVILTVGSEKKAESIRSRILESGRVRMDELLK